MFEIDNSIVAATILRVHGDVDLGSCAAFRDAVRLAAACAEGVVVDLQACTYFDCSGVGVLVRVRQEFGSRVKIVIPYGSVTYRLFELLELLEPFEIATTVDQAFPPARYPLQFVRGAERVVNGGLTGA